MDTLKIAVTLNENYVYPLRVMLYSLFSSQTMPVKVYIVHSRLNQQTVHGLIRFCNYYGAECEEVFVEDNFFMDAPLRLYFPYEAYYRLMLPWLLPLEDRILYLDPDIIVKAPLDRLWNIRFGRYMLAGARDSNLSRRENMTRIHPLLKNYKNYINTGVLMMNLRKMREDTGMNEIFEQVDKYRDKLMFLDQDLINLMYDGQIIIINNSYNFSPNHIYRLKEQICINSLSRSKKIVHYMGSDKPWHKGYRYNLYRLWGKAERMVYPDTGCRITIRILLEPIRYFYCISLFFLSLCTTFMRKIRR